MSISSANRGIRLVLHLQNRRLLTSSWAMKKYVSSGPVECMTGDYVKLSKAKITPKLSCSDAKGTDFRKKRTLKAATCSVQLPKFDGGGVCSRIGPSGAKASSSSDLFQQIEEFPECEDAYDTSFELTEDDVEMEFGVTRDVSWNVDVDKMEESGETMNNTMKQDAEKTAIQLLASRALTVLELKKKLRCKRYPLAIVDAVITGLKDRGLLNDGMYAESFSRSRWLSSSWGPKRIKQALIQKGVNVNEADKAMKQVFEEDETGGDCQNMQHGMSKAAMERLYLQASKQWLRGQNTVPENRKSRIIRWLQYRGFGWGVTGIILRRLQSEFPS